MMLCKLKAIREEKEITQVELSKRSGISRQTIIDIESGTRVNVTTETLGKLADALNCKVANFFD